jgi:hypothetical protein
MAVERNKIREGGGVFDGDMVFLRLGSQSEKKTKLRYGSGFKTALNAS